MATTYSERSKYADHIYEDPRFLGPKLNRLDPLKDFLEIFQPNQQVWYRWTQLDELRTLIPHLTLSDDIKPLTHIR